MRPSCGIAALGDVQARHHLQARRQLAGQLHWRLGHFLEHAVGAEAHAIGLFVGFEVDVRRALADGVQHQLVDEAHDGRVFDVVAHAAIGGQFFATTDLEALEVHALVVAAEVGHLRFGALDGLVDSLLQLVVFDDDGIDAQARLELDLVDGMQVGGIGHAQEQALAAAEHGQHAMLGQQLVGNQAADFKIQRHGVQVQQRHAEFIGSGDGDVAGLGGAAAHQLGHEMGFLLARGAQRRQGVRLADDPVLHQALGQPAQQPPAGGGHGQRNVIAHVLRSASAVPGT